MDSTTKVTVELDRKPTIEDVQAALDILRAEGIPDTFEVGIISAEEREYEKDVPYEDRRIVHTFRMSAERPAMTANARTTEAR